jgi:GNAT superfamily N-acetyltransferase
MNVATPIIKFAKPSDAVSLAKLAEKTFRDAFAPFLKKEDLENYVTRSFSETQIRTELLNSASTFFIASLKDKWVGYAKLYQGPAPDCVNLLPAIELARLYSMQQYLGCGIGAALLAACISYARRKAFKTIWLSSWKENHRGNAFYAKMQFEILGTKTFAIGSDIQDDFVLARSIQ